MSETILVTGGAGDIGRALARRFLAGGHRVALLDRDGAALKGRPETSRVEIVSHASQPT